MNQIRQWVEQLGIACEFATKDAYVYCSDPSRIADLKAEAEASRQAGLDSEVREAAPLPFATAGALRSRNQAQFNPAQYLIGFAKAAEAAGVLVFEETRVTSVEENDGWQLKAGRASIHCESVVLATALPSQVPYATTSAVGHGHTSAWLFASMQPRLSTACSSASMNPRILSEWDAMGTVCCW